MDTPMDENGFSPDLNKILARVATVLGSIESPDFSRVKLDSRRYARLIIDLSDMFWIRDISDVNSDVSSVLSLRHESSEVVEKYVAYVSNVGPYFFAMASGGANSVSRTLSDLIRLLQSHGLQNITKEVLAIPVGTNTFYSDHPNVFNLLFSDTDYLPWEN